MGFVRPRTVRPASGVCARSCSRPVPPALRDAEAAGRFELFFTGRFGLRARLGELLARPFALLAPFARPAPLARFAAAVRLPGRAGFFVDFRGAFFRAFTGPAAPRRLPRLRALARAAAPAFRPDDVRFCPVRFGCFLAMWLID